MPQQKERWRSAIAGTLGLKIYGVRGEVIDTLVQGGKVVEVTPEERRLNQELVWDPKDDPFKNGMLEHVKLLEDEFDTDELKSNPQVLTATEIEELFSKDLNWRTFDKRVAEISNPWALERLREAANEKGTKRQYDTIVQRLNEVNPSRVIEIEQMAEDEEPSAVSGTPGGPSMVRMGPEPRVHTPR